MGQNSTEQSRTAIRRGISLQESWRFLQPPPGSFHFPAECWEKTLGTRLVFIFFPRVKKPRTCFDCHSNSSLPVLSRDCNWISSCGYSLDWWYCQRSLYRWYLYPGKTYIYSTSVPVNNDKQKSNIHALQKQSKKTGTRNVDIKWNMHAVMFSFIKTEYPLLTCRFYRIEELPQELLIKRESRLY